MSNKLKLGISKAKLLSDPEIAELYEQYKDRQAGSGRGRKMKGAGIFDGFIKFLKDSKILSKVGDVLLPVGGAALAGLFTANPLGAAAGAAAGSSAAEYIRSQGFGKHTMMKGKGYHTGMGHCMMRGCGASMLTISPPGQRLGQRGGTKTIAFNGTMQRVPGTQQGFGRMLGRGQTSFGAVSSEFGKIRV